MQADQLARKTAQYMYEQDAASQGLGMELEEVRAGYARMKMKVRADMLNGHKICHGGFIFTLADSTFAFACNTYNRVTVAAGASIEFLSQAELDDELVAEAVEQARGNRLGTYDITVKNQEGKAVAMFRGRSYSSSRPLLPEEKK